MSKMLQRQVPGLDPKRKRPEILFRCYNLLGDGLHAIPVMRAFYEWYKADINITVGTNDDYIAIIYERMGIPSKVLKMKKDELPEEEFDFVWEFDVSKAYKLGQLHDIPASVSYGIMLGLSIDEPLPYYQPQEDASKINEIVDAIDYVLFQPYSISCSSWEGKPPNKRWPDERWAEIYRRIKEEFHIPVKVLGGKEDMKNYVIPGIPREDHCFALPLDRVANLQHHSTLVLTLDSGVAHLAASQRATILEFYPPCLKPHWMSNMENPYTRIIYYIPENVTTDYVWSLVEEELRDKL